MVFLEIIVIILAVWQFHDLFWGNALEKRIRKYKGYTTKEILDDSRTSSDFVMVFVLSLIGAVMEILTLTYLSLKRYLFPFSVITLWLFVMMYIWGKIKQKKRNEYGNLVIDYKKPSLFFNIFKKVGGSYVLIFYLALLYMFFID